MAGTQLRGEHRALHGLTRSLIANMVTGVTDGFIGNEENFRTSARLTIERANANVAGVNGDLFTFDEGLPSGMLMQGGVLQSPPYRFRSSIGITSDGKLSVGRVAFFGYWQGLGQRRPLTGLNQPPRGDGTSLFTPAWGASTPKLAAQFPPGS